MPESPGAVTVLILEDEPRFRGFLAEVMRDMGCTPITAPTAHDAMRIVDTEPPDMVFLDLNLPYVDGTTFLDQFRRKCPDTPVVVVTGYGDLDSAQRAIRHGVVDFLTKPCELGQIEQAVDRARRRLTRQGPAPTIPGGLPMVAEKSDEVLPLETVEREAIIGALRKTEGNRSAAARLLGISRRAVYNKIEEYRKQGFEIP